MEEKELFERGIEEEDDLNEKSGISHSLESPKNSKREFHNQSPKSPIVAKHSKTTRKGMQVSSSIPQTNLMDSLKNGNIIPTVQAFEIENKLRTIFKDLLEPIVIANKENHKRLNFIENVSKEIDRETQVINQKLDKDRRLRDMVDDNMVYMQRTHKENLQEFEEIKRNLGMINQLLNVHENTMVQINDDKKLFEVSRDQLRKDIKQFEYLI